ncbi:MAG: NHLP bacteriocin system secretion protein [Deltaproteobacteria bacterium]|nr:NHLP bacteriocin system secretion protein [Deltaproteobacteria bacterium]
MFRQRALAKLQSPEKLDEPQRLIRRDNKVALIAAASIPIIAVAWGFTGSVPEEGRGQGILISPGSIKPVQVPASGQIVRWFVREGDLVKQGQVIGLVEQIEIEQAIKEDETKLQEIEERNRVVSDLRNQYAASRRASIETRREHLQKQIEYMERYIGRTRGLASQTLGKNKESLETQKQNLGESKKAALKVEEELKKRVASYERLNSEKLISDEQLRDMRRDYEDAQMKVQEAQLREQELSLREVELRESNINSMGIVSTRENALTNLKLQLRELDNILAQLQKSESEEAFRRSDQVREVKQSIERGQKRLKISMEIRTEYAGRVLELSAIEGQVMSQGQRVAQIDTRTEKDEIMAIAYFRTKEGKLLKKGSLVRVTPATVDKKKHGGLIGEVQSVSDYPVTVEAVTSAVGNRTVAQTLTAGGYVIEVVVKLEKNPATPSGYRWTSEKGPDVQLGAGTGAEVWATVERRTPASYLIPKLRGWTGV